MIRQSGCVAVRSRGACAPLIKTGPGGGLDRPTPALSGYTPALAHWVMVSSANLSHGFDADSTVRCPAPSCLTAGRSVRDWRSIPVMKDTVAICAKDYAFSNLFKNPLLSPILGSKFRQALFFFGITVMMKIPDPGVRNATMRTSTPHLLIPNKLTQSLPTLPIFLHKVDRGLPILDFKPCLLRIRVLCVISFVALLLISHLECLSDRPAYNRAQRSIRG